MKIVYHSKDNDGRASAAIIYREYGVMAMMSESDFIGFDYNQGIEFPEIDPEKPEVWYFVDISLNWETFAQIKKCVEAGCKVVHIDHHRNQEFIDTKMSSEDKLVLNKVVKMYDTTESATMLCWIYTNMPVEDRELPMGRSWDFAEGYSHFIFTDEGDTVSDDPFASKEYAIPVGFRYVNDQDMFHKEFPETAAFTTGVIELAGSNSSYHINGYDDIGPMGKIWVDIFRNNHRTISKVIENGERRLEELEMIYSDLRKTAKVVTMELDGVEYNIICINTDYHGSAVAGELYSQYDAYCRYNYDKEKNKWNYTFYSRDEGKFLPCHLMCQKLDHNGGGHLHAAGCSTDVLALPFRV